MERYFKIGTDLTISLRKTNYNNFVMVIEGDYRYSMRKAQIHFNKEIIEEIKSGLLNCWKNTKTKKLKSVRFYFDEIDWYDNLVDAYTTPIFYMERGKKKPRVAYQEHGSIPKEWAAKLCFLFETTTKITPFMEVVGKFFDASFDKEETKRLEKMFRSVLKNKTNYDVFVTL